MVEQDAHDGERPQTEQYVAAGSVGTWFSYVLLVSLTGLGAEVVATDPEGIENARVRHPQLVYTSSTQEALRGAELVVLVTEWSEYRALDPVATGRLVAERRIIDGRNVLDVEAWRAAGWQVRGLGRP